MCGRYTLTSSGQELAHHFALAEAAEIAPRYNIAPSQDVPVVRVGPDGQRKLYAHRWGLVPAWAKDASVGHRMINARCETAASKPAFREALRERRCLIPMNGFYEWAGAAGRGRKTPYWFAPPDGSLLGAAGLWERWRAPDGSELRSCTILTTASNALVAEIHDRMPAVLDPSQYAAWLDPEIVDPERLPPLAPLAAGGLCMRPVSERVNDPRFDELACLADPDPPAQGELFGAE